MTICCIILRSNVIMFYSVKTYNSIIYYSTYSKILNSRVRSYCIACFQIMSDTTNIIDSVVVPKNKKFYKSEMR